MNEGRTGYSVTQLAAYHRIQDASQLRQEARTDTADADTVSDTPTTENERFIIDNEEKANWYLRKLANIDAEVKRITEQCATICNDLQRDKEGLKSRHQADLETWAKANLVKGRRNLKLLQGTINFRTVPAIVKVADPSLALTYCDMQAWGDCIKIARSVNTDAYKQRFKDTGELLPGIEITPEHESVSITFGKKE